ncbi:MAG: diguanylate cyclase response regulator [Moraxellaceae bacterium]|nr:MAG: diguanylate cyclase response regulator [Moraxellaceae bacterium]
MEDKPIVLVVDDSPPNIQVLANCLKDLYQVKVAIDGSRCLLLAQTTPPPDIILLDIVMPGLDGYEVCDRLKSDPDTRHIPVIFVTAKDHDEDEEKGLECGAVDYITKPIRPAIVVARVKTHITLKQQRDKLEELALKDQLTGLYNRHYLLEVAYRKVSRAIRHQSPLSVLMLDIDFFKKINDQYGHGVGDAVLREVSGALSGEVRLEDVIARFGGEEFVIVFDSCGVNAAQIKAQKLVEAVARLKPAGIAVTISVGVAELRADGETFETLLSRADAALYRAKEAGRNCVKVDG